VARDYLVQHQDQQFDPACVEAFLSRWDEVVAIATGQTAPPLRKPDPPLAPSILRVAGSHPDRDSASEAAAAV
jgi:putative two-component system response regulator